MKVHAMLFAAALIAAAKARQAAPNCGPNQEFNWVTWSCETQSLRHDQDQLVARLLEDGGAGSTGGTGGQGSGCPEDYVSDGAEGCVPASTPTITITRTSGAVEEGSQATYQISLNIRPASPLTVYTTVAGGTAEAEQALQGTITIVNPTPVEVEAGQFAAVQVVASASDALTWTVTIAVAEDDIVTGGGEAFYVAAMVTGSDEAAWSDVAASLNQEYTDDDKNPPVANAGADLVSVFDLEALTADDVQLDGSNSRDPEGLQLYYAWTIKSAPSDAEASLSSADEAKATLTGINKPGQYVAELTVRDSATEGSGLSSTDTATVYVPAVTAASVGSSGICYSGVDCTLSWTQTGFPADDVSVTVLLEVGEDTEILAANEARNGSASAGSLTAQVPSSVPTGSYTLVVLITGTFGETLATAARDLTVTVSPAVSYVVGEWSTCSEACGDGTQSRTVVCTDYTNTAVPASRCSGLTAPSTTQTCFLRPCESFGVRVGEWTACSAACGTAGVRNRTVECLNSDAEVVESSQCSGAGLTVPASSESCNRFPCEEFSYRILSTSGCNATCGSGTRYQSVVCRGNYGTMLPSSSSKCNGTAPSSFIACTGLPACASFIWTTGSWGACSKPCADAAGAGTTTRSVQCIDSATRAVVGSGNCTAARPASTRACNAKPCTTYAVTTGAFGQCTAPAGTCQGSRTRAVVCTALYANGTQATVPRTTAGCTTAAGQAASTIATSEACNSCGDCGTPGRAVECSGRGSCSSDYKCECPSGFSGRFCEVSTDKSCASGLKSNRGVCCSAGQSLDASGSCCSAIDRNGVCCAGVVDGCGVCNGDGELDAIGQCCPVAKQDSDGVCCAEELDLLGVCGGVNDGTQQVQSTMGNSGGFTKATISDRTRPDTTRMYSDTQEVFATALQRIKDSVVVRNLDVVGQRRALGAVSPDTQMRMLQSGSIAATTDLKPSGGGDNFVRPDEMAAKLAAAPATGLAAVTGVTSAGMVPTCGNGRCETGERPNAVSGVTGCPADCQFPVVSCPAANDKQCNGKGSCVSGRCVCLGGSGYVGAACDQCDVDFVASSGSCVRVAFAATCGDGVQNGDETGVDCGGSCSNACASDDDDGLSGGVIALIVIISLVGGGVIFLLFGSTVKAQRASNAHKAQVQDRSQMPHSQEPDLEVHDAARAPGAGATTLSIASREDARDSDFEDRDSRANQSPAASVHSRNTEVEHDNLSVGAGSTHSHVHPDHGADIEDEPVAGGEDAYEVDASDEDDRRSQHSNHSDNSHDSDAQHAEPVFV